MQINHSEKILSPYDIIKGLLGKLVYTFYTKRDFSRGWKGVCGVINNNILKHDGQSWLISYENAKEDFHKKIDGRVELDTRADKFLTDIFPWFLKVAKEHYSESIGDDNKVNDQAMASLTEIRMIGETGSDERKKCIKNIAAANYISNREVKLI